MTCGGLLSLGGFGGAFLPQPDSIGADIINVAQARAGKIKMHRFTTALCIFTPFPSA